MNSRERVFAMLAGEPVDSLPCMPITMTFAAARAGVKYREYATDYRALTEAQVRVAEDFDLDYVNTMSDPCVEAADCGAAIEVYDDEPFGFDPSRALLADKTALARLAIPDATRPGSRMLNRIHAVAALRERVGRDRVVEGWIEGPCAEAADLRGLNTLMTDFFDDPEFVTELFEFVLEMELRFAKEQVAAGADVIGIGDAAVSLIGPRFYDQFVQPYERRMVDGVHELGARARLHICGNTRRVLGGMGRLGCDVIDLDFLCPMAEAREQMGPDQVLLGNIAPVKVLAEGTPNQVTEALEQCWRDAGPRYVVAAGCEVPRATPEANLRAMVRFARERGA